MKLVRTPSNRYRQATERPTIPRRTPGRETAPMTMCERIRRRHRFDDDADEFGDRTGLQFLHDQLPIGFGRTHADTQLIGDDLGQLSFENPLQDLLLTRRQLRDALTHQAISGLQFRPLTSQVPNLL